MKKIVALNHKMYLEYSDVNKYIEEMKDNIRKDIEVVICPSSIFIPYFKGKYDFKLGAQNVTGVFASGENSGAQLKSMDVLYTIVGHSERKQVLKEENEMTNLNLQEALKYGIIPILCVGETKEQREMKKTGEVIRKQLKDYLKDVKVEESLVIAYEPVWAIGTGLIPNNDEIEEVIKLIKDIVFKAHGKNIRVLYGGSVNEKNVDELVKVPYCDGFLLGSVSKDPKNVLYVINAV